ncbi:aminotransferase, class III [Leucobacter sp. 7(1)]|uniref:phosphotransferase enzyme family protein n=1 Tax=Leucobacter sp. 7(1) TaxID=1255613 RepID=UPI00097EBE2E|nr:phosphotransferase [Leucobacter sp. 7(1)]SJN12631.1 aminotransferase, class III [Leucobacter sp. 7(1)]
MRPRTLTLDPREAAAILQRTHGITLTEPLHPLGSELASTFRARGSLPGAEPTDLAVKFQASDSTELAVQRWRAEVSQSLSDAGAPVPATVTAQDGTLVGTAPRSHAGTDDQADPVAVTVTSWVDASPYGALHTEQPGTALDTTAFGCALGAEAARMQQILATAPPPPQSITHTWAAETMDAVIQAHLPDVTNPRVRRIAEQARALLAREVAPLAPDLPRTLVHQDLHDSNVLADAAGRVAAILDFDDMLVGWRVAEPTVAAAYLARHAARPEDAVAAVAAGWESVLPFTPAEREVFTPLVLARLALNITVWHVRVQGAGAEQDTTADRADYARMRSTGSEDTFAALLATRNPAVEATR